MYKVYLKPNKEESLKRFHPWVFSGAIAHFDGEPEEGEVVEIYTSKKEFIAKGHFQIGSIAVRVLTFRQDEEINADFWKRKLSIAYDMRRSIGIAGNPTNNTYRLVHGEGDNLPGLVIDIYARTAVMQAHSAGMHLDRMAIADALTEVMGSQIDNIYYKSETTLPFKADLYPENGFLKGGSTDNVAMEYGLKFHIDWLKGQKTGFFVDQRENRSLLERYAKGRSVLNMFCYTGGFSVYAMRGDAKLVHSVDSSAKAIDLTNKNIELNFPGDTRHAAYAEDAFKYLDRMGDQYDLIVLDPPAFAKHRDALRNALQGYRKLNVKAQKEAQEAAFRKWAEANTLPTEGYMDALDRIREAVEGNASAFAAEQVLREALYRAVEILTPARSFLAVEKITDQARSKEAMRAFYKDYNPATDRRVAKRMMQIVKEKCGDLPTVFAEVIDKRFGGDTDAYVDYLYDNSVFATEEGTLAFVDDFSVGKRDADPAVVFVRSLDAKLLELADAQRENNRRFKDGHRLYIAGLMRMQPDKAWASDANFTIRLTYGRVLPYDPADGIRYNYYTTLKGVMEKEDPKNPTEFTVPDKLKELYAAKDFGRYANAEGELPVAFLADCDITGGNSGSPVMNAKGELIGLAFDGNWEAMSGDVAFEPQLQRTIAVDVRYVLFVIDKFAGAKWLIDELSID